MDFEDTPQEAAFRKKARAWLEKNAQLRGPDDAADELGEREDAGTIAAAKAWQAKKFDEIAIVRYGPATVGAAQWIRAHFLGEAEPQYTATRTSDVIEIVIGARYRQLATTTEVNQSLVEIGEPTLPPGACLKPVDAKAE